MCLCERIHTGIGPVPAMVINLCPASALRLPAKCLKARTRWRSTPGVLEVRMPKITKSLFRCLNERLPKLPTFRTNVVNPLTMDAVRHARRHEEARPCTFWGTPPKIPSDELWTCRMLFVRLLPRRPRYARMTTMQRHVQNHCSSYHRVGRTTSIAAADGAEICHVLLLGASGISVPEML